MMDVSGHAIYVGTVGHQRLLPKRHALHYPIQYFWLELTALHSLPAALTQSGLGAFRLRRQDYLRNCPALASMPLLEAVLARATELGATLTGDEQVFLLSPLANWGRYFSPLTQYYIYRAGAPLYLLAEVSNTPWNERHHYLVPLAGDNCRHRQQKQFHVSPFNSLAMEYRWHIHTTAAQLQLSIENYQASPSGGVEKIFAAWYQLDRQPLNQQTLKQALIRQPWQNVQILIRIYWHALRLLLKGVPFVPYQKSKDAQV